MQIKIINLEVVLIGKFFNVFFLTNNEKTLFKEFSIDKNRSSKKILIQCVEDPFYFALFGTIIKAVVSKEKYCIEQYTARCLTYNGTKGVVNILKSIFLYNRFRDNKWIKLYSAYVNNVAYRQEGSTSVLKDILLLQKAYSIYKNLNSKDDILNIKVDEILIGDLIYDSYLRFKPEASVNIKDKYLCIVIWQALRNIDVAKKYFKRDKPKILLTSYSTYIQHGITVRIALSFGTKVYSFGNFKEFGKELTFEDYYHTVNCDDYYDNFSTLKDKTLLLKKAETALTKRLHGYKDLATAYMKKSAYIVDKKLDMPDVKDKVVVFLHDFFDSPHIYGDMVFPDFLTWVETTIEIFEENNIPFILKPHPNQIDDSAKVIKRLKKRYPNLQFVSPKITNRQLVDGGIKLGVSVYGTVAHELVYMGVPIVLCGKNPHSSFNFIFEAKSLNEYNNLLQNYLNLSIGKEKKYEVEAFYFMHNMNQSKETEDLMKMFIKLFYKYKQFEIYEKMQENKTFQEFINKLIE